MEIEDGGAAFAEAMQKTTDKEPPMRGMAADEIDIASKRTAAPSVVDSSVNALIRLLGDGDPFVFLCAVRALANIFDAHVDRVFPALLDSLASRKPDHTLMRIRLGEAIMLCARKLGDLLPLWAPKLVRLLIIGASTRAQSSIHRCTLRSSCFSNLAEICGASPASFAAHATDILSLTCDTLKLEPDVEVKRAAAFLLARLLLRDTAQRSSSNSAGAQAGSSGASVSP